MKILFKSIFFILLTLPLQVLCQKHFPDDERLNGNVKTVALTVGDSVPDFIIPKIFNARYSYGKISDFDNQLLLIDFWSTNCSGCIAALPRLEDLQKKIGNRLKILPVTYESESIVSAFWKNNKYTKSNTLPSVVEDKIFQTYFPHIGVPHEIWIYNRKVVGITTADYVDEQNITRILAGENVNWKIKNDFFKHDYSKKLFDIGGDERHPIIYTALSGYKSGINTMGFSGGRGIIRNAYDRTFRTYMINEPIHTMYVVNWMSTYKMGDLITPSLTIDSNQTVWEVLDRSKYRWNYKDNRYPEEWILTAGHCFESVNKDSGQSDSEIYRKVNKQLDEILGLHVRWEKRTEIVWVLNEISSGIAKKVKGEKIGIGISVSGLISKLNNQEDHPYVFDETPAASVDSRISSNLWIRINLDLHASFEDINMVLSSYGLILRKELRTVDKLIFTEVSENNNFNQHILNKSSTKQVNNATQEENERFLDENKEREGVISLPSGLQYRIIREGNGIRPKFNNKIKVHYTGMQVNGKVFETTLKNAKPVELKLADVIDGWKEALALMKVGSKWIIYIPSFLGYGSHTAHGSFPPNSNLIFEIELIEVVK
ncbi:FKBP-type peptidyl-prolyl cis-trans isomerase [Pedobacter sp. MC2016-15]|uniref:FKBP-type peptidyl-prolyl cis-trans isomerase n=1 Tax=Pedobacter sp. MC2016-15 TaxID=2994473 RepID=UPI00224547E2|nr:FKBP-type peptidyl-prolyl cis-trans isomerase [Pedobacter sp. MC2016-15]MCX2477782.1 FKBP-type peptidyl-prolyl cis-trans isomerase [Pedobacter sp. MC2016-15]